MKKLSTKNLLIILTVVALLFISTSVYAAEIVNPLQINVQGSGTTTNTTTNETTTNTIASTTNTVKVNTTTNTASASQNTDLPKTGDASDYVIYLFIAVCSVVAIYAYRKVKHYNI